MEVILVYVEDDGWGGCSEEKDILINSSDSSHITGLTHKGAAICSGSPGTG